MELSLYNHTRTFNYGFRVRSNSYSTPPLEGISIELKIITLRLKYIE